MVNGGKSFEKETRGGVRSRTKKNGYEKKQQQRTGEHIHKSGATQLYIYGERFITADHFPHRPYPYNGKFTSPLLFFFFLAALHPRIPPFPV